MSSSAEQIVLLNQSLIIQIPASLLKISRGAVHANQAVDGIREVVEKNGYELALLEKYTDVNDLYKAVADADALIVRSDKVTKEVIDHAKNLKIVVRVAPVSTTSTLRPARPAESWP